jgi:hypothetical protein
VLRSIDLAAPWDRVRGMHPAWIVLALIAYAGQQMIGCGAGIVYSARSTLKWIRES